MGKVWLIGEHNPHGVDPRFALFPAPAQSSGARLQRILGVARREYLAAFERRNLLATAKWSLPAARVAAARVHAEARGAPLILLGARVCAAFGLPAFAPFFDFALYGSRAYVLPHPSGLSRAWNNPSGVERARRTFRDAVRAADGDFCAPSGGGNPSSGCPECSFELLHGRVGSYDRHTCDAHLK